MTYYVTLLNGSQEGPYTHEELIARQKYGKAPSSSLIWHEGLPEWLPIDFFFSSQEINGTEPSPPPNMPPVNGPPILSHPSTFQFPSHNEEGLQRTLIAGVGSIMGVDTLHSFKLHGFLKEIFKNHTTQDLIDFFAAGGSSSTPNLQELNISWTSPWIFSRILIFSTCLYFGFDWMFAEFENILLLPAILFTASFAFPVSILILFAELNIKRNISWYSISKCFFAGGFFSLLLTLIINSRFQNLTSAIWAGPIEEIAKLLATIFIIRKSFLNGNILNGMLCGAGIGAGFAAFETFGYNFFFLLQGDSEFENIMHLRALTAPCTHILWTAITAGGFWLALKDKPFKTSIFFNIKFLRILMIPIGLHMLWNNDWCASTQTYLYIKCAILGIVGWIVALTLVQAGIKQLREDQLNAPPYK